jgi:hypothetical protein
MMVLPDYHVVYHRARALLELGYFVATLAICYLAWRALAQLEIAKVALQTAQGDLETARKDISTRIEREAASETLRQLKTWADEIIPAINAMSSRWGEIPLPLVRLSMERFDLEELGGKDVKFCVHHDKVIDAFKKDASFKGLVQKAQNLTEASAMAFMTGVANEELAFAPLSDIFCHMVEMSYPAYAGMRKQNRLNQWEYTIRLYQVWSQRRAKHQLVGEQELLKQKLEKAERAAAPVKPLGS